jgi:hypothetical protein
MPVTSDDQPSSGLGHIMNICPKFLLSLGMPSAYTNRDVSNLIDDVGLGVPTMESYANYGGNSGVAAYATASDSITVRFKDGSVYLYNDRIAGASNISYMKVLANQGQGLNSFINTNVRKQYARKLS